MGKNIIEFITEGALIGGIRNWVWLAALAAIGAIALVIIQIADNRDKRMIETAKDAGGIEAVSQGKSTTLQQNKDANDAEDQIRRGGDAAVDGCMSDARGDASGCERFRD